MMWSSDHISTYSGFEVCAVPSVIISHTFARVLGFLLLPLYVLLPIWHLWRTGKRVKDSIAARARDDSAGLSHLAYKVRLLEVQDRAEQDILYGVKRGSNRYR